MTTDVVFYTTAGCHLCDDAARLLAMLVPQNSVTSVDIAEDDALLEVFGERIPVVEKAGRQLGWPFSLLDLQTFLAPP